MPRGPFQRNPQFETPQRARSHRTPALADNTNRLQKYMDPDSDEGHPLSRLGIMLNENKPLHRWQTPTSVLGETVASNDMTEHLKRNLVTAQRYEEAGLPAVGSKGEIGVGARNLSHSIAVTPEHEMMHKAIMAMFPLGYGDAEVIIRMMLDRPEDRKWVQENYSVRSTPFGERQTWEEIWEVGREKREQLERRAQQEVDKKREPGWW